MGMYPHVVSYLHDVRAESGSVASDMIYGSIFSVLAGLLACGLLAALLIRPVAVKHFMQASELAMEQEADHASHAHAHPTDSDHGSRWAVVLSWAAVGLPLVYGVTVTVQKAIVLFR
jgi:hypothetical protein